RKRERRVSPSLTLPARLLPAPFDEQRRIMERDRVMLKTRSGGDSKPVGSKQRMSEASFGPPRGAAGNTPRKSPVDQERIQAAVREILLAVGEDPEREGLRETPARVARMYAELFSGIRKDPREPLQKTFTQKYDEMVLVKDIAFASCCEHHLLP